MEGGKELAEIQAELQAVKKALREGFTHLGLQGEALQRYLLQLNEKENLVLSRQLRSVSVSGGFTGQAFEPLLPPAMLAQPFSNIANRNGASIGAPVVAPAQPLPPGPPKTFNKENVDEVVQHMCQYEASPGDSARSLRALSALAYSNAQRVGEDQRALPQLLRLIALHRAEGVVQLAAMRALSNIAYDQAVALRRLARPDIMMAMLRAYASKLEPKEISIRASEALARIIAAEVHPETDGVSKPPASAAAPGALAGLFLAASSGEATVHETMPSLLAQLVANEVLETKLVAEGFVRSAKECVLPSAAVGWLCLAKLLSVSDEPELPPMLIEAGAIRASFNIMETFIDDAPTQLTGIEAMSGLVGNRWAGLQAFADVGGMQRVEAAMRRHGGEVVLQTKGVRALASGVQWPADIQDKAKYAYRRAVELTKLAMSRHSESAELQFACLEALAKYLEKLRCVEEVKEGGGEGLVKLVMTTHMEQPKVQIYGRQVLEAIGIKGWSPKAATLN